ncbi:hypothetical protein Tco_0251927 [Tanacetum coccineum]
MTTPANNNQMHNDIMAAGSKERPPMLEPFQLEDTPSNDENPRRPGEIIKETYRNTNSENRKLIEAEAKAVHMILNEIGNDIYPIMDVCPKAKEMWITIERLQQRESINIQNVKTKLFWEFGKFTSRDWESIESYYTRFYIMMNEMVRNQSKGKEIVKPPSPPSDSGSEEDNDEEHAQKDKQIQKSLALIAKHFKNIYKPTNNNLKTSSNSKNKNVDTSLRTGNDRHTGQFENQRTI